MPSRLTIDEVVVPSGTIRLRDDRKKTQWICSVKAFSLSTTPITQHVYTTIMHTNPSTFTGKTHPVEGVSWRDAIEFCNAFSQHQKLQPCYTQDTQNNIIWNTTAKGYRLPTDAEWEYACRAGLQKVRYGLLDDIAWYAKNSNNTTHPVGQKRPNTWGLYDMLGNVWEWCWDVYDPIEYGDYRVFRGGGWFDPERGCLASNRRRSHPTYAIDDLGFRIARTR